MRYGLLIIFAVFFIRTVAQQNNYIFRHIDQSDGLIHTEVRSIVQDAKGYIWILTRNGLQRYDGSRFVNYPYDLNNHNYLTTWREVQLFSDKQQHCLWMLNQEIEKLDLQNNSFTLYSADTIAKNNHFHFTNYTNADNGRCLMGDFGLLNENTANKTMRPMLLARPDLSPNKSGFFVADNKTGQTWMTDWTGLSLFDKKTGKVYTHAYNPINDPFLRLMDKRQLTGIMKDSRNNFWISTGYEIFYKYDTHTRQLYTYSLAAITNATNTNHKQDGVLIVKCFFEDNHHTIWAGTSNAGLLRYDHVKDSFTATINQETNRQGLHYNYEIFCIFQDKEENMWVGTDKGINIFNPYRQYFQSLHHEEKNPLSIPKNELMNFIQAANGDILAGTWGGGITVYDSNRVFKRTIYFPGKADHNLVWCFVQHDDGNIWIGCQHGILHIYDPAMGVIQTIQPPELRKSTVWSMAKDKKGNIWFGLNDGRIANWDNTDKKFHAYNELKDTHEYMVPVFNIYFDSKQRCWVSTEYGLKEFNTDQRVYSAVYLKDRNNPSSISSNAINGVEEFNDTTLLIGTVHGGLNFFNPQKKTFRHLTVKDGLPANTIHALKKDPDGNVWFTTDYELYKYIPAYNKSIKLNIEPGTVNTEFKTNFFYTLHDGSWLTATITELIGFNNRNNFRNKTDGAKIEITGFKIFDRPYFIDSLLNRDKPIELSHKQNFLTIEFALLNFSNRQQTKYAYRLSGIDKDWVNTDVKNFASYSDLGPGKYVFSVKTENDEGSLHPTSFTIIIAPPFWKTWWFVSLCGLIAALLVYALIRRRIQVIRHEAKMKQQIAETEMMALRAQMNPHFIFNCLNSIDNLIQMNEKEKATSYLSKFAKLIRSILETSKNNVVPCWKDMDTLQLYLELESLRFDNKFSYTVNISPEILNGDYKVPPLVIQPFVENAIHHGLLNKMGADKKLVVSVSVSNNNIYYLVEDNGVGRAKAAAYKALNKPAYESMGMQITTDRINLFNQHKTGSVIITDLVNENKEPAGTKVAITLINQP